VAHRPTSEAAPALAAAEAERQTALLSESAAAHGPALLSLTGGHTPRALYRHLGDPAGPWRRRIDWPRLHVFWGDERHVPPTHPDSNFAMAEAALLAHVPIPAAQVHRLRGEVDDAGDAAREYEGTLREGFAAAGRRNQTFDVMLLGLGADAHIASIFPGSPLLEPAATAGASGEAARARVAAMPGPAPGERRITLTPEAILDSRAILVVVAGETKADAVQAALTAGERVAQWPAQMLRRGTDRVEWYLDRAAAARLQS
jgi:6-phosphogluconolactonase